MKLCRIFGKRMNNFVPPSDRTLGAAGCCSCKRKLKWFRCGESETASDWEFSLRPCSWTSEEHANSSYRAASPSYCWSLSHHQVNMSPVPDGYPLINILTKTGQRPVFFTVHSWRYIRCYDKLLLFASSCNQEVIDSHFSASKMTWPSHGSGTWTTFAVVVGESFFPLTNIGITRGQKRSKLLK